MPTLPAPQNTQVFTEKPLNPSAPPETISSSHAPRNRESTIAGILFIISLLLLCSLIGVFIAKSSQTFRLDTPVLSALPATINKNTVTIEGTGPKKATMEISSENTSYFADSDNNGNFSLIVETRADGKLSFIAIARKKVLFFKFESDRSNEVFTLVDKTAPNLKLVSLPRVVTKAEYTLKGTSSEPVKIIIKVNKTEHSIETNDKNNFSFPLTLQKGNNIIIVTAKDKAGNETSTANLTMAYTTGSVYVSGNKGPKTLPNSSGELTAALSTSFGRIIAFTALIIGALGFMASSGLVFLYKEFRKKEV